MHYRFFLFVLGLVVLGCVTQVRAQCTTGQLSPNPNPAGNEILIATGSAACNGLNPFDNHGRIENAGTLNNNARGTLNNNVGGIVLNFGTLNNDGTLNNYATGTNNDFINNFGTLNNNGTINNYGLLGTSNVLNNYGRINNFGNFGTHGGQMNNYGTIINYVGGGIGGSQAHDVFNASSGTIINEGFFGTFNNAGLINNKGSLGGFDRSSNTGVIHNFGSLSGGNGFDNAGTINNNFGGLVEGPRVDNSGTINNNAGGELHFRGASNFLGNFSIRNSGTINSYSGSMVTVESGPILNTGQFSVFAGASLATSENAYFSQTSGTTRVDGSMAMSAVNINGGVLQGSGIITAPVTVSGGTVAPGNSPGILTINGNYIQSGTGTFAAEIGGRIAGIEYDVLRVLGIATLDGTLRVTLLDLGDGLFAPHPGDTFDILSAEQIVGTFSELFFPELTRGRGDPFMWQVAYLTDIYGTTDVVRLSVVPIPEPEIYAMMLAGLGVLGWVGRRKRLRAAVIH